MCLICGYGNFSVGLLKFFQQNMDNMLKSCGKAANSHQIRVFDNHIYYLHLHKVMALRPNLGVIVAGGWAGVESYNGRSKPPGAFFLGLFLFYSGYYNYQEIL